jgi:hypothetical protein
MRIDKESEKQLRKRQEMKRTMPWLSDISFDLMVNFDSSPSEPN